MQIFAEDILIDVEPFATAKSPIAILHGCNCFHTMGAGLAAYLVSRYPAILEADKQTAYGDRRKLGTCLPVPVGPNILIVNCYTQFRYGSGGPHAEIKAIDSSLRLARNLLGDRYVYRIPKIGCGYGGLSWTAVSDIVADAFIDATYGIYDAPRPIRFKNQAIDESSHS